MNSPSKPAQDTAGEPATPLWLRAASALEALARPVVCESLCCMFNLPSDWTAPPALTQVPTTAPGICRGPSERDWLVISFMPGAVPGHNMLTWVEAPLHMFGFPEPAVQPPPELLWWAPEIAIRDYQLVLGAEEAHAFTGLVRFPGGVARLYTLLARKQRFAWKVVLSFASAAGEGSELACMRDDDKKAAVVFGALQLASPPK
jgi:hypothetical protein